MTDQIKKTVWILNITAVKVESYVFHIKCAIEFDLLFFHCLLETDKANIIQCNLKRVL